MLASNGAEHSETSWLFFFFLDKMWVCVNLKSILILGTVVERVINWQSKAHESGSKVLFLSCHWPAAWCLGELYPLHPAFPHCKMETLHSFLAYFGATSATFCTWVFQHHAVYKTRVLEGKCIAFVKNQAQWSQLGCLELQMLQLWVHHEQGGPPSSGMCLPLHPVLAHAKRTHRRWTAVIY